MFGFLPVFFSSAASFCLAAAAWSSCGMTGSMFSAMTTVWAASGSVPPSAVEPLEQVRFHLPWQRRYAVSRVVASVAHHLRAHVLEFVGKFDFLGDGHAVLGDARCTKGAVDDDIRPLGPSVTLTALLRSSTPRSMRSRASVGKFDFLGRHDFRPVRSSGVGLRIRRRFSSLRPCRLTSMMSLSFMIRRSSPSILTSVPLPNSTASPALTSSGMSLPFSSREPGPAAMTSPCCGFSLAVSGMMMPPLDLISPSATSDDDAVVKGPKFHEVLSAVGA